MMISTSCTEKNVPPRPEGPGDIYTAAGYPCETAHSTTRALFASYNGPLYQVKRQSDGKTLDIGVVRPSSGDPGGYADAASQDKFCKNTVCWITTIYDQSGNENHLYQAPPGTFVGPAKGGFNELPIADMAPITIMGHKVYGTYIIPGMGLRNNDATGLGINDEPEGFTRFLTAHISTAAVVLIMGTHLQTVGRLEEQPCQPFTLVLLLHGEVAPAQVHGSCPIWRLAYSLAIIPNRILKIQLLTPGVL